MIDLFKVFMSKKVDKELLKTIHSGFIGQFGKVKEFENLLAEKFNNLNCLSLSAGTHGLHLALRLVEVGPGDEVITTPLTCAATNFPILMQGASIVWADVKFDDLNIDPESIRKKINGNTKAIMVMHWGGYPCDMEKIFKIAETNNLIVIEDAAHAFCSTYKGHLIGDCEYSDFAMMSFQAIKCLTCGDGGALFCRHDYDYEKGKLLRWYGIDREGPRKDMRCEEDVLEFGYKYHMNDICAVIGINNFVEAESNVEKARRNAKYYIKELSDFPGIYVPQVSDDRSSSYWLFTIYVEDRSGFSRLMGEKGIMVSRVHERNDKHTCVKDFEDNLPTLDKIINKMICIPVGWWLTKEDREYIVASIKEGW